MVELLSSQRYMQKELALASAAAAFEIKAPGAPIREPSLCEIQANNNIIDKITQNLEVLLHEGLF